MPHVTDQRNQVDSVIAKDTFSSDWTPGFNDDDTTDTPIQSATLDRQHMSPTNLSENESPEDNEDEFDRNIAADQIAELSKENIDCVIDGFPSEEEDAYDETAWCAPSIVLPQTISQVD